MRGQEAIDFLNKAFDFLPDEPKPKRTMSIEYKNSMDRADYFENLKGLIFLQAQTEVDLVNDSFTRITFTPEDQSEAIDVDFDSSRFLSFLQNELAVQKQLALSEECNSTPQR